MFEGILPSPASAGSGALRAPAWPELVARLAAARDLRGTFARPGGAPFASFAPIAASELASRDADKGSVNRDALVDGKGDGDTTKAAAQLAGHGDRETQ
jgi:hypothetical protein